MHMLYDIDTTLAQECPAVCAVSSLGNEYLLRKTVRRANDQESERVTNRKQFPSPIDS